MARKPMTAKAHHTDGITGDGRGAYPLRERDVVALHDSDDGTRLEERVPVNHDTSESSGLDVQSNTSDEVETKRNSVTSRQMGPSKHTTRTLVETSFCPVELRRGSRWSQHDLRFLEKIGQGAMSSVYLCECSHLTGMLVVTKVYHKHKLSKMNVRQIKREIDIHSRLNHPNIIKLYVAFEDRDSIYLVEEYAAGGDLYKELARHGGSMLEAHVSHRVISQIVAAVCHLHARGILHRDIKPENIFLTHGGTIKLGDFGLAVDTTQDAPVSKVGTLDYMAPEVACLNKDGNASDNAAEEPACSSKRLPKYGLPVDIWCIGVLVYELLLGSPPFISDSLEDTMERIGNATITLPQFLTRSCIDFITSCLEKDFDKRPSASELLAHSWATKSPMWWAEDAQSLPRSKSKSLSKISSHKSPTKSSTYTPEKKGSPFSSILRAYSDRKPSSSRTASFKAAGNSPNKPAMITTVSKTMKDTHTSELQKRFQRLDIGSSATGIATEVHASSGSGIKRYLKKLGSKLTKSGSKSLSTDRSRKGNLRRKSTRSEKEELIGALR